MPLIRISDDIRIKSDGTQPLLVFSDGGRSMALVVDEIVDIVEEVLDIQVASERDGVLGSAIIKGEATEILDVGHFLPLAFADWFRSKGSHGKAAATGRLLFVEDSAFFRNLLTPVLRAAGYEVTTAGGGEEALGLIRDGAQFDIVITDLEMPDMDGVALARSLRGDKPSADMPIIALSAATTPETVARVREAGFHDFVAKFDRQGLLAALKEQSADIPSGGVRAA
jgi:two-component system chemotaxis sensor kinase CheA